MKKINSVNEIIGQLDDNIELLLDDLDEFLDELIDVKLYTYLDDCEGYHQVVYSVVLSIDENYEIIYNLDGSFKKIERIVKDLYGESCCEVLYIVKNKKRRRFKKDK